ncbi:MAG: tail fiber protein [Aliarcobacter sp.]|nr:tail fiber protein [Aliarcobacter sp.]
MNGYISEIRMVPFDFVPDNWLPCDGRVLKTEEYPALFSLIDITYGGTKDKKMFALPDLRGRTALCFGKYKYENLQKEITVEYKNGEYGGLEDVSLIVEQMPAHSHIVVCSHETGNQQSGENAFLAYSEVGNYTNTEPKSESLVKNNSMVSKRGGNVAHNNIQPSIGLNFLICVKGVYPRRD